MSHVSPTKQGSRTPTQETNSAHLMDGGELPWRVGNEPSDARDASQHVRGCKRFGVAPAPAVALPLGERSGHQITVTAIGGCRAKS